MTADRARRRGTRLFAALGVAVVLAGLTTWSAPPAAAAVATEEIRVPSGSGADAVEIDTTLYVPDTATEADPAPAILVAHGFGGSKRTVQDVSERLADLGYVVLAFTSRGFGNSTGTISVQAPDFEIADASTLIDLLSERPEVLQDSPGDPRVGIYGRSYGGALALLTAGYDDRVDAIAPGSTWNSLVSSLFPNDAGAPPAETPAADPPPAENGVFKRLWAQLFFESGGGTLPAVGDSPDTGTCGDYRPDYCSAILEAASQGALTPDLQVLLERSSPASILDRITAPTLLTQGEGDTLFPLSEADANARGIAANGTPVKMIWYSGGHGARTTGADTRLQLEQTAAWFDYYLRDEGPEPDLSFFYSALDGATTGNEQPQVSIEETEAYPGLTGEATGRTELALSGDTQQVLNPAGGTPAALSAIPPGLQVDEGAERNSEEPEDIPDQTATFESEVLGSDLTIVGAPVLSVRVASPSGEAVLFGKLYDVDPEGEATLLLGLVSPLRLTGLAADIDEAEPVSVTLPAVAVTLPEGHRLQVGLASTDQVFLTPAEEQVYEVALGEDTLSVPQLGAAPGGSDGGGGDSEAGSDSGSGFGGMRLALTVAVGLLVLLAIVVLALRARRRAGS